jgi:hypothetical protein
MQTESAITVTAAEARPVASSAQRSKRSLRTFWQIFGAPIGLAVISLVGLVIALVGSGTLYDAVSWITLTIPVIVILKYLRSSTDRR